MSAVLTRALKNSAWHSLSSLAIQGLNFLLILVYAHTLGPETLGALVTAQAQVLLCVLLVEMGLGAGLISVLYRDGTTASRRRALVAAALAVRLLGALCGAVIVFTLAGGWSLETRGSPEFWLALAYVPYLFVFACQQTAVSVAAYHGRQALVGASTVLPNLLAVLASLFLVWRGASITTLLFVHSWWGLLGALWVWASLRGGQGPGEQSTTGADFFPWRALAAVAWPYALVFAAITIWSRIDQLVVSHWLGLEAGGQYALAVRLVSIPLLVSASVSFVLFPDLQRLGRDAPKKLPVYVGTALKVMARYGLPAAALLLFSVGLVIAPLLPKYRPALDLLPWFVPGVWFYWMQAFAINAFWSSHRYGRIVGAHLWALLAYGMVIVPLATGFGSRGVAVAFCLFGFLLLWGALRGMRKSAVLDHEFRLWSRFTPAEAELWASILRKFSR